jgi:tetratricopeptide (TPR) repeat protein
LARRGGAGEQRGRGETGLARRGDGRQPSRMAGRRAEFGEVFEPRGATQVALLRLARNWHNAGSTYQAIHAYTQVLTRYPNTGAARAATEELLDIAETLERQGRFHAALNIFNQLEQLA